MAHEQGDGMFIDLPTGSVLANVQLHSTGRLLSLANQLTWLPVPSYFQFHVWQTECLLRSVFRRQRRCGQLKDHTGAGGRKFVGPFGIESKALWSSYERPLAYELRRPRLAGPLKG